MPVHEQDQGPGRESPRAKDGTGEDQSSPGGEVRTASGDISSAVDAHAVAREPAAADDAAGSQAPSPLPVRYRRRALGVLGRSRLQQLCDCFQLEVKDRRAIDSYVTALVRARRVEFGAVLRQLKRDELQLICDELELDRSGREKEMLVVRILDRPSPTDANDDHREPEPAYQLTPARKRTALAVLNRNRLLELTSHFTLEVHDLRAKADHISAITRKRSLPFGEVLERLSRDELKTMCVELGLDDSGREKRLIVERILGEPLPTSAPEASDAEQPAPGIDSRQPERAPEIASDVPEAAEPPAWADAGQVEEFPLVVRARQAGVLDGQSALIIAPTATGKSYIGRQVVRRFFERGGQGLCVYLVPFRALAWEIYESFAEDAQGSEHKARVRIATGDATDPVDPQSADVLVATYERFSALGLSLDFHPKVMVVDEIHLLADATRGPNLEMLLSQYRQHVGSMQLCGLSAVIDEPQPLADWLGVELVLGSPKDRQVPVEFGIEQVEAIDEVIGQRVPAAVSQGSSALVFCQSKAKAQSMAVRLASEVKPLLTGEVRAALQDLAETLVANDEEYGAESLAELLPNGVAYHHAGLVRGVRRHIENAYRNGDIKAIACTPTLAAGVNLPAELVLLCDVFRTEVLRGRGHKVMLPVSEVLNMLGRAGRPGQADQGRGIVLVEKGSLDGNEKKMLKNALARGVGQPVTSRMGDKLDWIMRLILKTTGRQGMVTRQDLGEALETTLWYRQQGGEIAFERPLQEDLMEDIPAYKRAAGLQLLSHQPEPDGVTGRVQGTTSVYDIEIRISGLSCSCPARKRWHAQDVCKHLARAIHDLLFDPETDAESRHRTMYACLHLFRNTLDLGTKLRHAADVLVAWGLLDRSGIGSYRPTPAGRVAAASGLDLLLITDAYRRIAHADPNARSQQIALWTTEDFFGQERERQRWLDAVGPWLEEQPIEQVPLPKKHRGDFENGLDDLGRVAMLYAEVARAIGRPELADRCTMARACLKHGVKPDAIPLAALNIPQLGRRRCRYLVDECGIGSLEALAAADPLEVADPRRAPRKLAEQWVLRAKEISERRASIKGQPQEEQTSELDELFAAFRVDSVALA